MQRYSDSVIVFLFSKEEIEQTAIDGLRQIYHDLNLLLIDCIKNIDVRVTV